MAVFSSRRWIMLLCFVLALLLFYNVSAIAGKGSPGSGQQKPSDSIWEKTGFANTALNTAVTSTLFMPFVSRDYPLNLQRILIPGGEFHMGCDAQQNGGFACQPQELPLHLVYLDSYIIDKYEVTNARYASCVAAGACIPLASATSATHNTYYGNPDYANYPVIYVSWLKASAFCAWTGGRLPSEAEWEKAARGTLDTRAFPWGNQAADCNLTSFSIWLGQASHCSLDTEPVGSHPMGASIYGVEDIAGSVWEWVNDWLDTEKSYYPISPYKNPPGPLTGEFRVYRGGSWSDEPFAHRVAMRSADWPINSGGSLGFRCAYNP